MSSNWQNDLTFGIQNFQRMLEDDGARIGKNEKVKQSYQEALDEISKSRESISRFVATFNKEYSSPK
jgi:hypothetical protein